MLLDSIENECLESTSYVAILDSCLFNPYQYTLIEQSVSARVLTALLEYIDLILGLSQLTPKNAIA